MLGQMHAQANMAPPTRDVASHAPVQQYAMQHFDAFPDPNQLSSMKSPKNLRHHPYSQNSTEVRHQHRKSSDMGTPVDSKSTNTAPVRRRISRACDQCNQLRTRCDGQEPCAHCSEFGMNCEYMRERKKRGKTSRKDMAQQDPAGSAHSPREYSSEGPSPTQTHIGHDYLSAASQAPPADGGSRFSGSRSGSMSTVRPEKSVIVDGLYQLIRNGGLAQNQEQDPGNISYLQSSVRQGIGASLTAMSLNDLSLVHEYDRPGLRGVTPMNGPHSNGLTTNQMQPQLSSQQSFQGFGENAYLPMSPPNMQAPSPEFRFGATGESPLAGFFGTSPIVGSPGWLNLPSTAIHRVYNTRFACLRLA